MSKDINYIDIKEFREFGYLQEVNRLFFHPLGLALEVNIDDETGEESLGRVWDYREEGEGIYYGEGVIDPEKAKRVADEQKNRRKARVEGVGYWTQRVEDG